MEIIHSIEHIAELLQSADDIIISAHTGPDGDAIGSVCALNMALKNMGKNVIAVLEEFPKKYHSIQGADEVSTQLDKCTKFKTFIALDCADKGRLGRFVKLFDEAEITIAIDHHISNVGYAKYNYIDGKASATSEILYDVMMHLEVNGGFHFNSQIASALYAGILSDTGGFRHPQTTASSYIAAATLINSGADFSVIYKNLFNSKSFEELQITAVAFQKIKREFNNRFIWTSITSDDLKKNSAGYGDIDSIVDLIKNVEGTEIAAFFYQKQGGEFKVSMRSEAHINISEVASKFGGGGHKNAAGCTFFTSIDNAVNAITKEIEVILGRIN